MQAALIRVNETQALEALVDPVVLGGVLRPVKSALTSVDDPMSQLFAAREGSGRHCSQLQASRGCPTAEAVLLSAAHRLLRSEPFADMEQVHGQ